MGYAELLAEDFQPVLFKKKKQKRRNKKELEEKLRQQY
jgi:hypothetical protein